jgi:hypothetical protein
LTRAPREVTPKFAGTQPRTKADEFGGRTLENPKLDPIGQVSGLASEL